MGIFLTHQTSNNIKTDHSWVDKNGTKQTLLDTDSKNENWYNAFGIWYYLSKLKLPINPAPAILLLGLHPNVY